MFFRVHTIICSKDLCNNFLFCETMRLFESRFMSTRFKPKGLNQAEGNATSDLEERKCYCS